MAIIDNQGKNRYEYVVDGHTAFIDYRRKPGLIALTHTEVPTEIEGRGVGTHLAREVLDAVRANGEKVISHCSFIEAFIKRNPEYRDLLAG
jgi:hypothetical protein